MSEDNNTDFKWNGCYRDGMISLLDAAAILGVKKSTMKQWCQSGKLKTPIKTMEYNRWPNTVERWMMSREELADIVNRNEVAFREYKSELAIDQVVKMAEKKANEAINEIDERIYAVEEHLQRCMDDPPGIEGIGAAWVNESVRLSTKEVKDFLGRNYEKIDFSHLKGSELKKIKNAMKRSADSVHSLYFSIVGGLAEYITICRRINTVLDMLQAKLLEGDKNQAEADAALVSML